MGGCEPGVSSFFIAFFYSEEVGGGGMRVRCVIGKKTKINQNRQKQKWIVCFFIRLSYCYS